MVKRFDCVDRADTWWQTKDRESRCRALRQQRTAAEQVAWEILRGRRCLGLKFKRQYPMGPYVADFYCHEHRVVVELDGPIHASQKDRDRVRDEAMQAIGISIIRLANEQIQQNPKLLVDAVARYLNQNGLPSPR